MTKFILDYLLIVFVIYGGLSSVGDMSIEFKWFDIWIGFYFDQKNNVIYFCPFPMIVFICKCWQGKKSESIPLLPAIVETNNSNSPKKVMYPSNDGYMVSKNFDEPIPIWKEYKTIDRAIAYLGIKRDQITIIVNNTGENTNG